MEIKSGGAASASATLEIKAAQLSKNQQEQEGKAAIQLVESAAASAPKSSNPSLGSIVDTFA